MIDAIEWVKLNNRWHDQSLLIVFKCLRKLSPSCLSSQFEFVPDNHSHLTRSHTNNTLVVPKFNSNSLSCQGICLDVKCVN